MGCRVHGVAKSQTRLSTFHFTTHEKHQLSLACQEVGCCALRALIVSAVCSQ